MATATTVETAESRAATDIKAVIGRLAGYAILAAVALWMGWELVTNTTTFFSVFITGLQLGVLYALIALGYTLVYGIIELINFSHGDLFMLGAVFSGFMLTIWLGVTEASPIGWVFFLVTLVAAMIFCGGINVAAERIAYRRLRRAPKLAALITAVGLSFIYQWVGLQWNGSAPRQWPSLIDGRFTIGDVPIPYSLLLVGGVTIPLLIGLTYIVRNTRQGKAMRATAQDQDAARLMGIDVDRTIAFTFALGGAMAGAAGLLYMQAIGTASYNLGFQLGLIAFTAAVLGGIGNLTGAVLGGVLIGVIQGLNDGLGFGQKWSQTVVFTILIMLMVFKPEGLLGKPTTEKV